MSRNLLVLHYYALRLAGKLAYHYFVATVKMCNMTLLVILKKLLSAPETRFPDLHTTCLNVKTFLTKPLKTYFVIEILLFVYEYCFLRPDSFVLTSYTITRALRTFIKILIKFTSLGCYAFFHIPDTEYF